MSMQERFEQMVEFTGCNQNLLMMLFNTGAFELVSDVNELGKLVGNAIDKIAYQQEIGGVKRGFVLAVGSVGSLPKYNMRDEEFDYVKFEYELKE